MSKARASEGAINPYLTAEEAIYNLNQMFGEVDREARAEAELQNPKFAMGVSDPKETFPAFYARFTSVIAPLALTDHQQKTNLKRLVTRRLRNRILDGYSASQTFAQTMARLRQLDTELRIEDENTSSNDNTGNRSGRSNNSSNNG